MYIGNSNVKRKRTEEEMIIDILIEAIAIQPIHLEIKRSFNLPMSIHIKTKKLNIVIKDGIGRKHGKERHKNKKESSKDSNKDNKH